MVPYVDLEGLPPVTPLPPLLSGWHIYPLFVQLSCNSQSPNPLAVSPQWVQLSFLIFMFPLYAPLICGSAPFRIYREWAPARKYSCGRWGFLKQKGAFQAGQSVAFAFWRVDGGDRYDDNKCNDNCGFYAFFGEGAGLLPIGHGSAWPESKAVYIQPTGQRAALVFFGKRDAACLYIGFIYIGYRLGVQGCESSPSLTSCSTPGRYPITMWEAETHTRVGEGFLARGAVVNLSLWSVSSDLAPGSRCGPAIIKINEALSPLATGSYFTSQAPESAPAPTSITSLTLLTVQRTAPTPFLPRDRATERSNQLNWAISPVNFSHESWGPFYLKWKGPLWKSYFRTLSWPSGVSLPCEMTFRKSLLLKSSIAKWLQL